MRLGLESLDKKFMAPEFVQPTKNSKNIDQLIAGLKTQRDIFKQMIKTLDLTETVDFKHPVLGSMTRLEWAYFIIYHTERHLKQLQRIVDQLQPA